LEKLIRDKINKIQDHDERRLLRDILLGIFMEGVKYNQERCQQLEEAVFQELSVDQTQYAIYTTVCNSNDYKYKWIFISYGARRRM